jgi:hypothetical protein
MSDPVLAPYQAIVEHAELELELAGRGELAGLATLGERWEQLVAGLPQRPPARAGQLLERAQLLHERTRIELLRVREALIGDVTNAQRARRTADGYGSELIAAHRLDRTA